MKLVRFSLPAEDTICSGLLEGHSIHEFAGDMFSDRQMTGRIFDLEQVSLRAPIVPNQIIGIGKNFVPDNAEKPSIPEMPILFFKPLTTVVGPGEPVVLPQGTDEIKFESELAVIIGRTAKDIHPSQADDIIFGFTVANDLGAFNYFHPEGHWTIGKAFDTFCPLGPIIETDFDYRTARIHAAVNGVMKQDAAIERIITPIAEMIAYISRFMTLNPGDVILTGTPAGSDYVRDGDVVDCWIDGIGRLSNHVQAIIR
ncbi:fumarylacetoacetate hydrolase family protein [Paenibacillus oryzisoli]|uniref:fumarylacetoacetate hydrolase family protein n=1 Tax=Paenibacillus oryzisoli TaxID=1850517 RepID=UPI003D2ADA78